MGPCHAEPALPQRARPHGGNLPPNSVARGSQTRPGSFRQLRPGGRNSGKQVRCVHRDLLMQPWLSRARDSGAKLAQAAGLDRNTALLASAHALADGIIAWRDGRDSLESLLEEAVTPGGIAAATMAAMDAAGYGRAVRQGRRCRIAARPCECGQMIFRELMTIRSRIRLTEQACLWCD